MKMHSRSTKGFTLVEIMIVVVIIGLLAAMAIPAFQKVRTSSLEKTVLNDGRQIGAAAQQYFMEYGQTTVSFTYASSNGALTGDLTNWVKQIGKNYTISDTTIEASATNAFDIKLNGAFNSAAAQFDAEGKKSN